MDHHGSLAWLRVEHLKLAGNIRNHSVLYTCLELWPASNSANRAALSGFIRYALSHLHWFDPVNFDGKEMFFSPQVISQGLCILHLCLYHSWCHHCFHFWIIESQMRFQTGINQLVVTPSLVSSAHLVQPLFDQFSSVVSSHVERGPTSHDVDHHFASQLGPYNL